MVNLNNEELIAIINCQLTDAQDILSKRKNARGGIPRKEVLALVQFSMYQMLIKMQLGTSDDASSKLKLIDELIALESFANGDSTKLKDFSVSKVNTQSADCDNVTMGTTLSPTLTQNDDEELLLDESPENSANANSQITEQREIAILKKDFLNMQNTLDCIKSQLMKQNTNQRNQRNYNSYRHQGNQSRNYSRNYSNSYYHDNRRNNRRGYNYNDVSHNNRRHSSRYENNHRYGNNNSRSVNQGYQASQRNYPNNANYFTSNQQQVYQTPSAYHQVSSTNQDSGPQPYFNQGDYLTRATSFLDHRNQYYSQV